MVEDLVIKVYTIIKWILDLHLKIVIIQEVITVPEDTTTLIMSPGGAGEVSLQTIIM